MLKNALMVLVSRVGRVRASGTPYFDAGGSLPTPRLT
jgi:hypothetical protein